MAITPGKLQTQSSAHALVIRPDTAPAKYLPRLLIYAVITLEVLALRTFEHYQSCNGDITGVANEKLVDMSSSGF
jgi:hypothetical protein